MLNETYLLYIPDEIQTFSGTPENAINIYIYIYIEDK